MKIDPIELEQENIDVSTSSSDTLAQEAAEVVPESSDLLGDPSIAGFDASKTNNEEVSPSNEIKAPVLPNEPVDPQEWDHDMLESFTQQLNAIKQSLEAEKNEIIAELRRTTTELHETKKALSEAEARILKLEEDRATFNRSQDIMTSGRKGKLDILASAQSSSSPPPSITLPGVPMEVDPYTIAPWTDEETAKIKISAALGKPTTVTFDLSDTRRILHESNAFGSFLNQFPPLETIAHEDEKFSVIWKVLSYACFHGWNDVVFDYIINAKAPTLTFFLPQHLRNVDRIQLMQSVFQYLVEKRAFIQWGQAFHESLECWIARATNEFVHESETRLIDFILKGLVPSPLKAFLLVNRIKFDTTARYFLDDYKSLEDRWERLNYNEKQAWVIDTYRHYPEISERLQRAVAKRYGQTSK